MNVDWNGRHEDSCGRSETGETPQTRSGEEARRSPAESEVPGVEINIHHINVYTASKKTPTKLRTCLIGL